MWRGLGEILEDFLRDEPRERDLALIFLNSPSLLRQFVMSIPLPESASSALESAMHEKAAPLALAPGECFFTFNSSIIFFLIIRVIVWMPSP